MGLEQKTVEEVRYSYFRLKTYLEKELRELDKKLEAVYNPLSIERSPLPVDHYAIKKMNDIFKVAAEIADCKPDLLKGRSGIPHHQDYKTVICKIARECKITQSSIAEYMGYRDHSAVTNKLKKFNDYIDTKDERVLTLYNQIKTKLNEIQC